MARTQDASHASLDDLCEILQEADEPADQPLLFKYDGAYLDVESFTRTDDGALIINLQEA